MKEKVVGCKNWRSRQPPRSAARCLQSNPAEPIIFRSAGLLLSIACLSIACRCLSILFAAQPDAYQNPATQVSGSESIYVCQLRKRSSTPKGLGKLAARAIAGSESTWKPISILVNILKASGSLAPMRMSVLFLTTPQYRTLSAET